MDYSLLALRSSIGILIDGILKAIKSNTKANMPTPKPEPDPKHKPNLHLPQNQTQMT